MDRKNSSITCPLSENGLEQIEKFISDSIVLEKLSDEGASVNKSTFVRACILFGLEKIDEFGKYPHLFTRTSTVNSTDKALEKILKNSEGSKNE